MKKSVIIAGVGTIVLAVAGGLYAVARKYHWWATPSEEKPKKKKSILRYCPETSEFDVLKVEDTPEYAPEEGYVDVDVLTCPEDWSRWSSFRAAKVQNALKSKNLSPEEIQAVWKYCKENSLKANEMVGYIENCTKEQEQQEESPLNVEEATE